MYVTLSQYMKAIIHKLYIGLLSAYLIIVGYRPNNKFNNIYTMQIYYIFFSNVNQFSVCVQQSIEKEEELEKAYEEKERHLQDSYALLAMRLHEAECHVMALKSGNGKIGNDKTATR